MKLFLKSTFSQIYLVLVLIELIHFQNSLLDFLLSGTVLGLQTYHTNDDDIKHDL